MSKPVELHNAYQWDCDECGKENFCRAVVVEITPEDAEEFKKLYEDSDEEEWQTGNWMTRPEEVTCAYCGKTFDTVDPGD